MRILQFGTGRFLRGFFAPIVSSPQSITVIQSRPEAEGAQLINQRQFFHVLTRGIQDGKTIDESQKVNSLGQALVASESWNEILDLVLDPELNLVVSNTTEKGLQLDERDQHLEMDKCPNSYPARLLALLYHRHSNGLPPITVLPLELVENNGSVLRELVVEQAATWRIQSDEFMDWLRNDCRWLSNLVDRIVVSVDPQHEHASDPLAVMAEPYRMLAIEDDGKSRTIVPEHEMVEWVSDLRPKFVRKVRILNGLHTAMVAHSFPQGFETVADVMNDSHQRRWIESLLDEEILPALNSIGLEEREFANQVLERFENPFFRHYLRDIANHHETKLETRIRPTFQEFEKEFGRAPEKLGQVLSTRLVDTC